MILVVRLQPPRPISDLIVSAMPQLSERLVEYRIGRGWSAIVGPDVARRTRPRSLANGVLDVVVDNAPWLHELTLRADELTERIHQRFADVRALRFVPGPVEPPTPATRSGTPRPAAPLSPADLREIEEATSVIQDPTLAAAARRLLLTARRSPKPSGGVR
jgi:hypothetical protein